MESHGGNVELLSLEDGVARIHLQGSCSDCSASSVTLELAIKQALEEAAPDLAGLEVEGVAPQLTGTGAADERRHTPDGGRRGERDRRPGTNGGRAADRQRRPRRGGTARRRAGMDRPRFARRPRRGLDASAVRWAATRSWWRTSTGRCSPTATSAPAAEPRCATGHWSPARSPAQACGRSYFLPRAGRSLDADRLQLKPVPLLRDRGSVRVALVV